MVKTNEIGYLGRGSAALGEIADPRFREIVSSYQVERLDGASEHLLKAPSRPVRPRTLRRAPAPIRPETKHEVFNLHAASVAGAEDRAARACLVRYVLRPSPIARDA